MKMLFHNKRGQNVAEYAILIALVVGAVIAMQKFVQRGFQARMRDASQYMVDQTPFDTANPTDYKTGQYEPYYQDSQYDVTKDSEEEVFGNSGIDRTTSTSNTTREAGGQTNTKLDSTTQTIGNGMEFDN